MNHLSFYPSFFIKTHENQLKLWDKQTEFEQDVSEDNQGNIYFGEEVLLTLDSPDRYPSVAIYIKLFDEAYELFILKYSNRSYEEFLELYFFENLLHLKPINNDNFGIPFKLFIKRITKEYPLPENVKVKEWYQQLFNPVAISETETGSDKVWAIKFRFELLKKLGGIDKIFTDIKEPYKQANILAKILGTTKGTAGKLINSSYTKGRIGEEEFNDIVLELGERDTV